MPVSVRNVALWRREVENKPGVLATALEPFALAGTDLKVLMAYRFPGNEARGVIELCPVTGRKSVAAAETAGLGPSSIPTVLVEGDNRPGLGHSIAQAVAEAGINLAFLVAQVIGEKYSAVVGFENEADAQKATPLIRKAVAARRR